MDRRKFIANLAASGLAIPTIGKSLGHQYFGANDSCISSDPENSSWPGIILNTVKNEMKLDFRKTLEQLSKMGYRYLEGSFHGESAEEYKRLTDDLGFKCVAGGSSMGALKSDLTKYLKIAEALEYEYIVCYYPWLTGNDEINIAASYTAVDNLNSIGKQVKDAGFRFAWHPHNWEFIPRENDQRPFDIIMQNTNPELVFLELDIYWVYKGGSEAIKEMKKYPGRTTLFHVKDMSKNQDKSIACVGEGIIDFKPILEYATEAGFDYWFVENETDNSSIQCAHTAIDHMNRVFSF